MTLAECWSPGRCTRASFCLKQYGRDPVEFCKDHCVGCGQGHAVPAGSHRHNSHFHFRVFLEAVDSPLAHVFQNPSINANVLTADPLQHLLKLIQDHMVMAEDHQLSLRRLVRQPCFDEVHHRRCFGLGCLRENFADQGVVIPFFFVEIS